jgi:hypothetical protein
MNGFGTGNKILTLNQFIPFGRSHTVKYIVEKLFDLIESTHK